MLGPWVASKVLAIRNHLGLAGTWSPLAQHALDLIQANPALKVLEGLSARVGYLPGGHIFVRPNAKVAAQQPVPVGFWKGAAQHLLPVEFGRAAAALAGGIWKRQRQGRKQGKRRKRHANGAAEDVGPGNRQLG